METLERGIELECSWTMTSAEYQQLVEFLGHRFTEIDRRFDEVGRRFDEMGGEIVEVRGEVAELRREMLGLIELPPS